KRRAITHGFFVHSEHPEQQALEVIRRLDLRQRLAPLTRCLRCNGRLVTVTKDEVFDHLEPLTRRYYDEFSRCAECGRIYWPGSHHARLVSLVERLRAQI
ncbi:MAG: Mut7-C RNAse domain-containing protein, partial [Mycobacterium sp.]